MDAKWFRNSFIWLIVMVFVLAIAFQVFRNNGTSSKAANITGGSQSVVGLVETALKTGHPLSVAQDGQGLTLTYDNVKYSATLGPNDQFVTVLNQAGIPTKSAAFNSVVSY